MGGLAELKNLNYSGLIRLTKNGQFALPEIQRRFVWDLDRVAELWDSIYHGFPIGCLLFWTKNPDIPLYSFEDSSNGVDKYLFINKRPIWSHEFSINDKTDKIVILDGQQRITSLFLGASECGVSVKKRRNSTVVKKYLSIYIGDGDASGDNDIKLFDWKEKDSDKDYIAIADALKSKKQHDNIRILKARLRDRVSISYLVDKNVSEVVEVFRRLNNGGVKMSRSELILAMWMGNEGAKGMREELDKLRSAYGPEFNVQDSTITQLLGNIFGNNFDNISQEMPKLIKAAQDATAFINEVCGIYSNAEMTSHNLFIPITHIFYKTGGKISDELMREMRCFVYRALVFSLFEKSTNSILQKLRESINRIDLDKQCFIGSLDQTILKKCFGDFEEGESQWLGNEIQDLMELKKGAKTNMILLLLKQKPANMDTNDEVPFYEQDHLIAEHLFRDSSRKAVNRDENGKFGIRQNGKINENRVLSKSELGKWKRIINKKGNIDNKDKLPNLWLLESERNKSKGEKLLNYWYEDLSLEDQSNFWDEAILDKDGPEYLKITNFEQIFKDRSESLQKRLRKLLAK